MRGTYGSRSKTTASAAPTPSAERAYGVSPIGSRRSEGPFTSRVRPAGVRASPPRSPSAARRCEPGRRSVDLLPDLVRPHELIASVHRQNGGQMEVAHLVDRE